MEEEKAAAYYDELSRKGEGAAKFKQGLGFSSSNSNPFSSSDKNSKNTPLLSSFVRASNPNCTKIDDEFNAIATTGSTKYSSNGDCFRDEKRDRDRVVDSVRGKLSRRRSDDETRDRDNKRRRSTERSYSPTSRRISRDRDNRGDGHREKDREIDRERRRSRSYLPTSSRDRDRNRDGENTRGGGGGVDYSQLIDGYSQMTPAEKVKAKMKLQLKQTAAKDATMGMRSGWERFDFNKDAPVDDDDEVEEEKAEDAKWVVKDIGRGFLFSAIEARREEEVKAAHDLAMFGGGPETKVSDKESEQDENDAPVKNTENDLNNTALMSDEVLSRQQGSWRDRARRS